MLLEMTKGEGPRSSKGRDRLPLKWLRKALGQFPQYWVNLQAAYDFKTSEKVISRKLAGIPKLAHT
jgi:hypothetical protein